MKVSGLVVLAHRYSQLQGSDDHVNTKRWPVLPLNSRTTRVRLLRSGHVREACFGLFALWKVGLLPLLAWVASLEFNCRLASAS